MKLIMLYWMLINILTFLVFGIDKYKACAGKYRIREIVLFALSIAGGAAGGLLAMYIFRHKIRKMTFTAGLPLILVLQLISFYGFSKNVINIFHTFG